VAVRQEVGVRDIGNAGPVSVGRRTDRLGKVDAWERSDQWRKIEALEQRRFAAEQAAWAADIGSRKQERTEHPGERPRITEVHHEPMGAMPSEVVLVSEGLSESELASRQETISPIMALEEETPFFE
jgi:hypothetical protein